MSNTLKLIAQDDEQLTIISSLAQDSIIKSNEMGYDKKTKRFALLMNRYRHEEENLELEQRSISILLTQ